MYVIGTAGHVDHGKSTLVKALTSIDPDRLPQEKEREMTIDLGFAWMTLPSGREVSIVDVPGHERFIKNMLAGVGGIDLALLIVAADESVMPQTREHLAILDILRIKRGMVAITKCDLVEDELVELVEAEVEDALQGTSFESAPMHPVSAYTGQGLDALKGAIDAMLDETDTRKDLGRPRLPVDRSFTVAGFGTVVTGTLIDGTLNVGQEVQLAPSGERGRIRGLQSHRKKLDQADPGRRLAVNLSGIERDEVHRGEVLTTSGWLQPTSRVDALLRLTPDSPRPLKHNETVSFHVFTNEAAARVRLLDADQIAPGEEGWAQLHLSDPVPVVKGDLFVLRSADSTLGGGKVVDPYPARRHRRFIESVLKRLSDMEQGTGEGALLDAADHFGPMTLSSLAQRANLSQDEASAQYAELEAEGRLISLGANPPGPNTVVYSAHAWAMLQEKVRQTLSDHHRQHSLRRGMPREELRNRLGLPAEAFLAAMDRLASENSLTREEQSVSLPGHHPTPSPAQAKQMEQYLRTLESDPFSPPTDQAIDPELVAYLVDGGRIVKVSESVVFSALAYREMVDRVVSYIKAQGKITVAEGRDLLDASRKYVLPLMEHLDQQRVTRRVGDERFLR